MRKISFLYIGLLCTTLFANGQNIEDKGSTTASFSSTDTLLINTPDSLLLNKENSLGINADSLLSHPNTLDSLGSTHSNKLSGDTIPGLSRRKPLDPRKAYSWKIDERFGKRTFVPVDTLDLNFQNKNLVEYKDVAVNYLGTIGAPVQSKIFINNDDEGVFLFQNPYKLYQFQPFNFNFMNSKSPFSMISYNRDLSTTEGEERFNTYYSINVNRQTAFGFQFDLIYGRGYYNAQSTRQDQFSLFGSHITDKYSAHAYFGTRAVKAFENGGITDDRYITNPEEMSGGKKAFEPRNIPVHMTDAFSKFFGRIGYLTHHYDLGFWRASEDSTYQEYVPITSFIHTFKYEDFSKRYFSKTIPEEYYSNNYFDDTSTSDSTRFSSIKNTLAVSLVEGFNKYSKFGLTAFIEHDFRTYRIMDDPAFSAKHRIATTAGAELTKRQGNLLTFDVLGEIGIAGEELGRTKLKGNLGTSFRLLNDTVKIVATGAFRNITPLFYQQQYYSNHFVWNNNFKNEQRIRLGGIFALPKRGTELKVDVENLSNHIYYGKEATPVQASGSVQVITAQLNQNFKIGILHLDNSVVFQQSSNQSVIPVPKISLYHNLYIRGRAFKKELAYQIGADLRYHTEYYVPSYMPATGQFYNQDEIKIGGYPLMNVYGNFHLKNMRFFIMGYHIPLGPLNYFILPHYPMNPFHIKLGLAWNFHT